MDKLPATYESLARIAKEKQCYRLVWPADDKNPKKRECLVDAASAHAVVRLYEAVGVELQQKIDNMVRQSPHYIAKLAALAWGN
jgi:hypothetical protein